MLGGIGAVETFPDSLQVFLHHTDAGVVDGESDIRLCLTLKALRIILKIVRYISLEFTRLRGSVTFLTKTYKNGSFFGGIFNGVGDEFANNPGDLSAIGVNHAWVIVFFET